jgi:anti-sigma factor RsiW
LGRPIGKHIDNEELNALVPTSSESGHEPHKLSPEIVSEAKSHAATCADCGAKVSNYQRLVNGTAKVLTSAAAPYRANCPKESDVDWHEVAAGLWPEAKARQLIMHAALCDHCGPLLRAATSADPTPEEAKLLAELKAPSRPDLFSPSAPGSSSRWQFPRWLVPAMALMAIVGAFIARPSPSMPLSGPRFAEFAVRTHREHERGQLALEVSADSQQTLNQWFAAKAPFSLALPASPAAPGEERPYRLEGARLVQVGDKTAAFIAYHTQTAQLQTAAASLVVTPDSVAVASGGVVVDSKKVSFHYSTVEGYKVVTWSLHGLTYALVSEEGNSTQRSCMVCHSAMRDRDLSHTPAPLRTRLDAIRSFL